MIGYLSGRVLDNATPMLVDVGGIGYEVNTTLALASQFSVGDEAELFCYHHIREQSQELFGFTDRSAKQLFLQLIGINGVGPKVGLAILELGEASAIAAAITSGDEKYIQAASGVGKKVAQRVVIELKDKVVVSGATAAAHAPRSAVNPDALAALEALGYSVKDAEVMLASVDSELPTAAQVTQALKR